MTGCLPFTIFNNINNFEIPTKYIHIFKQQTGSICINTQYIDLNFPVKSQHEVKIHESSH